MRAIKPPRLVAVSKTKPKEMILEAYDAGHRDFGENYVQELADKSNDADILKYCPDIKWHFIGNCQTKNVNKLAKCRNLSVIETITSEKLADKLQFQFAKKEKESLVNVMVQVNTSGEENKNGIEPGKDAEHLVGILGCAKLVSQPRSDPRLHSVDPLVISLHGSLPAQQQGHARH